MITASAVVAADKVLNENTVRPGLLGLFFFVALFVALYFLWRSMNKQLKKVDAHFAEDDVASGPTGDSAGEGDGSGDGDGEPVAGKPEDRPTE